MLTPQLKVLSVPLPFPPALSDSSDQEHLSVVVKASQDCERDQLRLMNCSERLSPHNKECLDRYLLSVPILLFIAYTDCISFSEIIYQQCYLGQIVPTDLWREWKQCEKANPDNSTTHCRFELEKFDLIFFRVLLASF